MKYAIFTKPIHVEKLTNYLTQYTDLDFIISTDKREIYKWYDYDIGISYAFGSLIDIDKTPTKLWYNYHTAPLSEYKGADVYAKAIKDQVQKWAVTLHKMTMELDAGEIIKQIPFALRSPPTATNEIGSIAHYYLFQLFKETIKGLEEPTVWGTCNSLEEQVKENE